MNGERIAMSQRERDRLKVMASVMDGRRTQAEAARLMKRSVRQVRRIQRRLESQGDCGVIHKLRGRPSNNGKARSVRPEVVEIYRRDYADFGPTLASEKLLERGYRVCDETLRLWLLSEKLWQPRRRRGQHRQRRDRRECFGELVQADGSHHDWLEGRGPRMVLLVMIDDATSRAMARFYPGETTEGYMDLLWRHLRRHGRMVDLYTDKDSIFWGEAMGKEPSRTQFTRALEELGIGWIPAHSPQAKGRVERFNQTAQDRLVKELRLAGAQNMEQANAVLEKVFLPWFNRRCVVKAASPNDAHRALHGSMNLQSILSLQERRKVANDYTIRLDNQVYQLLKPAYPGLRCGWVVVEQRLDGTKQIRFKKQYLAYHQIGPADRPGALPPNPRSLTHGRTPAAGRKKEGQAVVAARPSAVRLTVERSGRTPAEPCPSNGGRKNKPKRPWRPPAEHPWRKFSLKSRRAKEDTLTLVNKRTF
jgi:Helix-turn-helix domain